MRNNSLLASLAAFGLISASIFASDKNDQDLSKGDQHTSPSLALTDQATQQPPASELSLEEQMATLTAGGSPDYDSLLLVHSEANNYDKPLTPSALNTPVDSPPAAMPFEEAISPSSDDQLDQVARFYTEQSADKKPTFLSPPLLEPASDATSPVESGGEYGKDYAGILKGMLANSLAPQGLMAGKAPKEKHGDWSFEQAPYFQSFETFSPNPLYVPAKDDLQKSMESTGTLEADMSKTHPFDPDLDNEDDYVKKDDPSSAQEPAQSPTDQTKAVSSE